MLQIISNTLIVLSKRPIQHNSSDNWKLVLPTWLNKQVN